MIWLPVTIIVLALVGHVAFYLWRHGRLSRKPLDVHDVWIATEPVEECTICAVEGPRSQMHLLIDTYAEPECGRGAGTAMIAAYCRDHCPGDCTHPEEHTG